MSEGFQRAIDTWHKMCARKKVLRTEAYAEQYRAKREESSGVKIYKYFCPVCSSWHITKVAPP